MSLTFVGRTTKRTTKINLGFTEKALTINKKGRIGISMGLAVETGLSTGRSFMFAYDDLGKKAYLTVFTTTQPAPEDAFKFETGTESYSINKKFHAEKITNLLGITEESSKLYTTKTTGTTEYDLYELTTTEVYETTTLTKEEQNDMVSSMLGNEVLVQEMI